MTLRVSTDNGRTYRPEVTAEVDHQAAWENAGPLGMGPSPWPPCRCPRHRAVPGTIPNPR
ncbi:hypothetical protein [Streptomyces sp. NPDC058847]|uniref:hypothetical protein n=1 Tax=Streptomyces sp. NPDC058847 TaxID=3346649 RepID=UPI0036900947